MKVYLTAMILLSNFYLIAQTPEQILEREGIQLPKISAPLASYVDVVQTGKLLFLAGKGPRQTDGSYIQGKVGSDLSIEDAYNAAKLVAINQLAVLKAYLGSLSKIKRIVKVNGFVNCIDSFEDQSKVINGFSDLMVTVFGDAGKHARTSVGVNALPFNMAVEVEMVVEIK